MDAVDATSDQAVSRKQSRPVAPTRPDSGYARYVVLLLTAAYILCVMDRQILTILAEDIKRDLGISDARLGFLYGTAFAVFYSVFGITFGRLADTWNRKKIIAIGIGFWSLMTAVSGLARGFLPLAACRFGVAIGEATLSPSAHSIIYDYFTSKGRTVALSIYSGGIYIGAGLGLFIGGAVLDGWNHAWPGGLGAPFGLKGWQAAFMIVGLPGLLLSAWISTIREPQRGLADGIASEPHPHPFRETFAVLLSMLPFVNWRQLGARSPRAVIVNALAMVAITIVAIGLTKLTGEAIQWIALGAGMYATVSWAQGFATRDPVVFGMIFRCAAMRNVILAVSSKMAMGVVLGFWAAPFFQRVHHVGTTEIGTVLGLATGVGGFCGVALGGALADRWRKHTIRGKLYVSLIGQGCAVAAAAVYLTAPHLYVAYAAFAIASLANSLAYGPAISTVNDLTLPRGRATTTAFSFIVGTFFGVALGPYLAGALSDLFVTGGMSDGSALQRAMLLSLLVPGFGVLLIVNAIRHIERDQNSMIARARALGENIP